MSREPEELGLFAPEPAAMADVDTEAAQPVSQRRQTQRNYGVFKEMDILTALRAPDEAAAAPAAYAQQNLVAAQEARLALETPCGASSEQPGVDIDAATEGVLRAAKEASEAAAILVLREAPTLSREARLELIGRITSLAGPAIDVLRVLASDADGRVRAAARKELDRLTRR
jgi:hypothetical protein